MTSKKLITAISMACLMAVLLVVGVWAVTDIDFSVGGDITYTVPIIVEDPDDYEYLTFTVTDATAKTVSVEASRKGTMPTDLVIPAYVDIDGVTYAVTSIPGGYDSGRGFAYTSISSITLPDTLKSIADYAFEGCSATKLYVGTGLEEIAAAAFVASSISYNVYENGNYLGSKTNPYLMLVSVISTSVTSFTIHEDCRILKDGTSAGVGIFTNCTSLESIIIPNKVKSIGTYAFDGCSGLTSVTIGSGVTSIGMYAFEHCVSLTSITIPDKVTSIGSYAFCGCTGLTSIAIPDKVTSIGRFAFEGCTGLASVELGSGVTSIGEQAFHGCTKLSSITIPDSVTSIGGFAFYGCTGLTIIVIPDSVTSIGDEAFYGCTSLAEVTVKATTPPTGGYGMFNNCHADLEIKVPSARVDAYKAATYWKNYVNYIKAGDF